MSETGRTPSPDDGWYWPMQANKPHYFRNGRSVCGRYGLVPGMQEPMGLTLRSKTCMTCERKAP